MNLPLFTESVHCESRKKCRQCQDRGDVGEKFRAVMRKHFTMPGPGVFACPFGEKPPPAPPRPPREPWEVRGPKLWAELHARGKAFGGASAELEWLKVFARRLGCGDCKRHWVKWVEENPPDFADYYGWTVRAHNAVNARLGKPIFNSDLPTT